MILFFIFNAIVHSEFQKDRSYTVSIKSKYLDVQTLDHFLYFLSSYPLNITNRFLSEVLQQSDKSQTINNIEFLSSTISNLNLISESSLSLLKSYIDIKYYLPRCEMFRSLVHDIAPDPINLINNDPGFFLASKNSIEKASDIRFFHTNITQIFNYDLNLNEFDDKKETIFIYADLTNQKASDFILSIINHQNQDFDNYNIILRPLSFTGKITNLRGFGVEMRPYKYLMEYESDDIPKPDSSNLGTKKEDNTTKEIDFEVSSDYINYSDITFFGSKFTNFIYSENQKKELPELLRDMSNNWPVYLRKISEEDVSVSSSKEYEKVSLFAEKSQNHLNQNKDDNMGSTYTVSTLNGRVFNIKDFDPFTFIDQVNEEQTFLDVLTDEFNLTKDDITFNEPFIPNDEYLLDYRTKYAVWNKDYEKDYAYKDWSYDLKNIFRLKKNIVNFAIYMEPTNPLHLTELYTLYVITEPDKKKMDKNTPILPMRIGVIPRFNLGSKASRRVSFAFAHLALHNQRDAVKFLIHTLAIWKNKEKQNKKETGIKEEYFILAYSYIKGSYKVDWSDLHTLYDSDSKEYKFIKEANNYIKSCGAKLGSIRVNGKEVSLDKSFQDLAGQIQSMVLSISTTCSREGIRNLKNVDIVEILKRNYLVVQSVDSDVLDLRVTGTGVFKMNNRKQKQFIEAFRKVVWKYKDDENPHSYFILFTPNTTTTETIKDETINKEQETNKDQDINKDDDDEEINDDNEDEDDDETKNNDDDDEVTNNLKINNKVDLNDPLHLFEDFANNRKHMKSTVFAVNPPSFIDFFSIGPNETTLLVNGRFYRSFKLETIEQLKLIDFWSEKFILSYLDLFINKKPQRPETTKPMRSYDEPDYDNIESDENNNNNDDEEEKNQPESNKEVSFDAFCYISAVAVDWRQHSIQRINVQSVINGVNGLQDCPLYYTTGFSDKIEWIMIVDPLSRSFQKIADFLYYMSNVRKIVDIQLIVVPPQTISGDSHEADLNTYYRFSLTSDEVTFSMLNDTTSYSTIIDSPQSWLLEQLKTSEDTDIDNIRLVQANSNSEASFLLDSIIVEGKCFIENANVAKFAEIGLFTKKSIINNFHSQKVDETTVLPMNSYYQFKAKPGVFRVAFSTNISSNLYTFDTPGNKGEENPLFDNIFVDTFSSKEFVIQGKTRFNSSDSYKHSLQERINRMKTELNNGNKTKSQINIFTISSGKLYERLCKIMFLSVREHTTSSVTFYLIKSFLSPSFKKSLPEMSKKYSFNYYLVDYKWPSFLLKQKEKQRLIWANKILFLDLLFPTNVEKIIYVDADQIVRSDLQELMNLDITKNGAPYAFVPFCDSRPEIEPYRFWKQGYWKDNLIKDKNNRNSQSFNYHISALFSVDLIRFKEMLAGDQLRFNYQQLAGDPRNLANLDQDLPNSMQKQVPIYSLDTDWLWCETWCADEDMERAKTIDLCNNPMTKINKIDIARERVEEWPKLDEEAMKTEEGIGVDDYEQFVFHN